MEEMKEDIKEILEVQMRTSDLVAKLSGKVAALESDMRATERLEKDRWVNSPVSVSGAKMWDPGKPLSKPLEDWWSNLTPLEEGSDLTGDLPDREYHNHLVTFTTPQILQGVLVWDDEIPVDLDEDGTPSETRAGYLIEVQTTIPKKDEHLVLEGKCHTLEEACEGLLEGVWYSLEEYDPPKQSDEMLFSSDQQSGVKALIWWDKIHRKWMRKGDVTFLHNWSHFMIIPE